MDVNCRCSRTKQIPRNRSINLHGPPQANAAWSQEEDLVAQHVAETLRSNEEISKLEKQIRELKECVQRELERKLSDSWETTCGRLLGEVEELGYDGMTHDHCCLYLLIIGPCTFGIF